MHLRSFILITLTAVIAMATGGAVAYGTPIMTIAGVIIFLIAAASFAYGDNREMIYPSDMAPEAPSEDRTDPGIEPTSDIPTKPDTPASMPSGDDVAQATSWSLPTNVPLMPTAAMVITNTPVKIDVRT